MNCLRAFVLALISVVAIAEEAPYYMWTDENGVLNFSRIPPTDAIATELSSAKPKEFRHSYVPKAEPEPETDEPAQVATLQPNEDGIRSDDIAAYNDQVRVRNCERAEQTLARLTTSKAIILRGDDGLWREVNDESRAAQAAAAESEIAEFCDQEP